MITIIVDRKLLAKIARQLHKVQEELEELRRTALGANSEASSRSVEQYIDAINTPVELASMAANNLKNGGM
jgi:hypothetical protein